MHCPRDLLPLTSRPTPQGLIFPCAHCHGASVGLAVVRKHVGDKFADAFWQQAIAQPGTPAAACPSCQRRMREVTFARTHGAPLALDLCPTCLLLWFDGGELEALRHDVPPPPQETPLERLERAEREALEADRRRSAAPRPVAPPVIPTATDWGTACVIDIVVETTLGLIGSLFD